MTSGAPSGLVGVEANAGHLLYRGRVQIELAGGPLDGHRMDVPGEWVKAGGYTAVEVDGADPLIYRREMATDILDDGTPVYRYDGQG
jgi:hypothetical protein